jgi:hypothetical protein
MARAGLTREAWDAPLPLIRADSFAAPLTTSLWGIWTPSTGVETALFVGTRTEVMGTLSEGGSVLDEGSRLVIGVPF